MYIALRKYTKQTNEKIVYVLPFKIISLDFCKLYFDLCCFSKGAFLKMQTFKNVHSRHAQAKNMNIYAYAKIDTILYSCQCDILYHIKQVVFTTATLKSISVYMLFHPTNTQKRAEFAKAATMAKIVTSPNPTRLTIPVSPRLSHRSPAPTSQVAFR